MEDKNKRECKTVHKGNGTKKKKSTEHNNVRTKIIPKDIKKGDNLIKKAKGNTAKNNGSQTNILTDTRPGFNAVKTMNSNTTIKKKPQTNIDYLQKIQRNSVRITKQVKTYKQQNAEIFKLPSLNKSINTCSNIAAVNIEITTFPVLKTLQPPKSNKDVVRKSSKASKSKKSDTHKEQIKCSMCSCLKQKKMSVWKDKSINSNIPQCKEIVKSTRFKMTASIMKLLHEGQIDIAASTNAKLTIKNYLYKHPLVIVRLVKVIQTCRSFAVYSNAVRVLHQILVKSQLFNNNNNTFISIMKYLRSSQNLMKLVNNIETIEQRFRESQKFKLRVPFVYVQLFDIIVLLAQVRECKSQLQKISKDAVAFMYKLLTEQHNKELLTNLLRMFKIICVSSKMCYFLSCQLFYDSLCGSYKKTRRLILIVSILRSMAQTRLAIQSMSLHDKTVELLVTFINYKSKASVSKGAILTILYKIGTTESGLRILSRPANYKKLYCFFVRNEFSNETENRMKTYSILIRCMTKAVLPMSRLCLDFNLSDDILKYVEKKRECDENDSCIETNEDSSDSDNEGNSLLFNSQKVLAEQTSTTEPLQEMQVFLRELVEPNKDFVLPKLSMFKAMGEIDEDLIAQRVHRSNNLQLAFPDRAMVIPQSEEIVNSVKKFPLKYLLSKLNVKANPTKPEVVYNLDELYKTQEPADIPNPETFVPQEPCERGNVGLLQFESRFECGNLRRAIQIEKFEYDLIINPDTYTCTGYQWFYFQISNMAQKMYTFNIINFTRSKHLFDDGMQPVMFSAINYKLNKTGWKRVSEKVIYYGNNYTDRSGTLQYKTLSFSIKFPHVCDYVYVAYHYPYTYTRLMVGLAPFDDYKSYSISARLDKLCGTINDNNEVPLLTITAPLDYPESLKIPLHKRPIIFISARVHAGESNASWIMEGIYNYLLNETEELAITAREHYIFKIIPMLNPEGVIYGNTRLGLVGLDLNRCWSKPSKLISPEIYYTKRLIEYAKRETKQPIAAFIDIHGHSNEKCFFFYGCNPRKSWNSKDHIKGDFSHSLKLLPQTIQTLNRNIRLSNCRYDIVKSRESTGRVVMWREFGITQSYTLECTYSEGYNKQTMNDKTLTEIGESVIAAFGRIADTAYNSKISIANYGLDYSNMENWNSEKAEVVLRTANASGDK